MDVITSSLSDLTGYETSGRYSVYEQGVSTPLYANDDINLARRWAFKLFLANQEKTLEVREGQVVKFTYTDHLKTARDGVFVHRLITPADDQTDILMKMVMGLADNAAPIPNVQPQQSTTYRFGNVWIENVRQKKPSLKNHRDKLNAHGYSVGIVNPEAMTVEELCTAISAKL